MKLDDEVSYTLRKNPPRSEHIEYIFSTATSCYLSKDHCYWFRSVSAIMTGIFCTGMQTGTIIPPVPPREILAYFRVFGPFQPVTDFDLKKKKKEINWFGQHALWVIFLKEFFQLISNINLTLPNDMLGKKKSRNPSFGSTVDEVEVNLLTIWNLFFKACLSWIEIPWGIAWGVIVLISASNLIKWLQRVATSSICVSLIFYSTFSVFFFFFKITLIFEKNC